MTAVVRMSRHEIARACELAGLIIERKRLGLPLRDAVKAIKCGRNEPDTVWSLATRQAEIAA